MWQETKHGLYRQFNFEDFKQAFAFMTQVAVLAEAYNRYPRLENEWSLVQIWLVSRGGSKQISDKDRELAKAIDELFVTKPAHGAATPPIASKYEEMKIFADGGSRGNPGPSAGGYVLLDMSDNIIDKRGIYLGVTTNNQAEYQALKFALEEAKQFRPKTVHIYMDSLLVVNQMTGRFRVSNRDLWPIHDSIKVLAAGFRHINFTHIPREMNKLADAMVNQALDEHLEANDRQQSVQPN